MRFVNGYASILIAYYLQLTTHYLQLFSQNTCEKEKKGAPLHSQSQGEGLKLKREREKQGNLEKVFGSSKK